MISPDRQSWHCFGCNIGGDIFSFLMRYENIEFAEALKILAEKAGIELQRVSPADYRLFGLLYDLNDAAKEFYIRELKNSVVAINYLKSRGLKPETAAEKATRELREAEQRKKEVDEQKLQELKDKLPF